MLRPGEHKEQAVHMTALAGVEAGCGQTCHLPEAAGRGQPPGMAIGQGAEAHNAAAVQVGKYPGKALPRHGHSQMRRVSECREVKFQQTAAPGAEQAAAHEAALRIFTAQQQAALRRSDALPVCQGGRCQRVHGAGQQAFIPHAEKDCIARRLRRRL